MPRPVKCRMIEQEPDIALFKPRGIPLSLLEAVRLTFEELEAIRLKDLEGLDQTESASRMNISRATFQRILGSARAKVSDALVNGKAIRVEGGNYSLYDRLLRCKACGYEWLLKEPPAEGSEVCPRCKRKEVTHFMPGHGGCARKRCRQKDGSKNM